MLIAWIVNTGKPPFFLSYDDFKNHTSNGMRNTFLNISTGVREISSQIIAMIPQPEAFLPARCVLKSGTEKCATGNVSSICVSLRKNVSVLLFQRISETSENVFLIPLIFRWYNIKFFACLTRNIFNSLRNPPFPFSDIVLLMFLTRLPCSQLRPLWMEWIHKKCKNVFLGKAVEISWSSLEILQRPFGTEINRCWLLWSWPSFTPALSEIFPEERVSEMILHMIPHW